jgi:hypothetical protein
MHRIHCILFHVVLAAKPYGNISLQNKDMCELLYCSVCCFWKIPCICIIFPGIFIGWNVASIYQPTICLPPSLPQRPPRTHSIVIGTDPYVMTEMYEYSVFIH